jgi:hypothetical protein
MEVSGRLYVPGVHWVWVWVGPRADLHAVAKRKGPCPCRESNLCHPAPSLVTILTELFRFIEFTFMGNPIWMQEWYNCWATIPSQQWEQDYQGKSFLLSRGISVTLRYVTTCTWCEQRKSNGGDELNKKWYPFTLIWRSFSHTGRDEARVRSLQPPISSCSPDVWEATASAVVLLSSDIYCTHRWVVVS